MFLTENFQKWINYIVGCWVKTTKYSHWIFFRAIEIRRNFLNKQKSVWSAELLPRHSAPHTENDQNNKNSETRIQTCSFEEDSTPKKAIVAELLPSYKPRWSWGWQFCETFSVCRANELIQSVLAPPPSLHYNSGAKRIDVLARWGLTH